MSPSLPRAAPRTPLDASLLTRCLFATSIVVTCLLAGTRADAQSSSAQGSGTQGSSTQGSGTQSYDLDAAIDAMRAAHPALVAARLGIDAARGDETDAALWSNPVATGLWTPAVTRSTYDPAGYVSWGVSQFLELSDTPGARRRAAALLVRAAEDDSRATERLLALEVESHAVALAASTRRRDIADTYVRSLGDAARIVDARVNAGAAPQYDASRIAIALAAARADLAEAEADVLRARGELRASIGPGVEQLHGELRFDLDEAPNLPSTQALLTALRDDRADLASLRQQASSASASIDVARRAVFPGLTLTLGGDFGGGPGQLDLLVGVAVPLPVIDVGQGTIAAAEARADMARAVVDAVELPTREQITAIHDEVITRRAALDAYRATGVSASDAMLSEARAGYEQGSASGRFSVLELADAFEAWRDAKVREVDLLENTRDAELDLGRAIGASLRASSAGGAR